VLSSSETTMRRQRKLMSMVATLKLETGCADCGYATDPDALEFDHVRGAKIGTVNYLVSSGSLERLLDEIDKCEVVCANCHRLRSRNRRTLCL
jgi:hypothetical protein